MTRRRLALFGILTAALTVAVISAQNPARGIRLEDRSWWDAEAALHADAVVVIPLGSAARQHGPHLKLNTDRTIAEYLARRVADAATVAVAPALTYDHDPAFLEYPGSASVTVDTARDLTVDVARTFARSGPRRFYVLHAGGSTVRPLQLAAQTLATEGILLRYTDYANTLEQAGRPLEKQPGGSHADEIETSLMLHIAPESVDMRRAAKAYYHVETRGTFRLTRQRGVEGLYSPSGVWGDPTLATAQKGAALADALLKRALDDVEALRKAPLPAPASQPPVSSPPARSTAPPATPPGECTAGDMRTIRAVGPAFTYRWSIADAEALALLWAPQGDIIHPDGAIERTPTVIQANRRELFARREYRNSKHPLDLLMIRCPDYNVAIADGKWQMIGVRDSNGKELPPFDGQATLVFRRIGDGWFIEAYRYTMKATATPPPTFLKRPGWPGKG